MSKWVRWAAASLLFAACGPENEVLVASQPPDWGPNAPGGGLFGPGQGSGGDEPSPPAESDGDPGASDTPTSAPGGTPVDDPVIPVGPDPVEKPPEDPPPEDPPPEDPPPEDPPPEDPPPWQPPPDDPPPDDPPPPEQPPPDPNGCYQELYYPNVDLSDLAGSYSDSKWKSTILEVLKRRYPAGHVLIEQMQNDPYLPQFIWGSGFGDLMDSLGTVCHEETHGWDYDTALDIYPKHAFWNTQAIQWYPIKHDSFPRSEILQYIDDGSTELYDSTYLYGSMGSYDWVDHADEINSYINGLACNTTVGEFIPYGVSARDGAAGALLYLQLYLKVARISHPSVYTTLQKDAEWQWFVRYVWARGWFWLKESEKFPKLQIGVDAILANVEEEQNLSEIEWFTGHPEDYVSCHPEVESPALTQ